MVTGQRVISENSNDDEPLQLTREGFLILSQTAPLLRRLDRGRLFDTL
jgi:hypothetical protein